MASQKSLGFLLILSFSINLYLFYLNRNLGKGIRYYQSDFLPLIYDKENDQKGHDDKNVKRYVKHCLTEEILGVPSNVTATENFLMANGTLGESPSDRKLSFETVFKSRAWGKDIDKSFTGLSASGPGSTLYWAQDVIGILHKVVNEIKKVKGSSYKVKLLDVPCGDFVWMNRFLTTRDDIDYTGMDIVPDLIKHHNDTYKNKNWKFLVGDVVVMDTLDNFDIILCRMMLQHLTHYDAQRVLNLFSKMSSGLLITTTFSLASINTEVQTNSIGRFRELNLEIPPFSLTPPICISSDGLRNSMSIFTGIWQLPLEKVSKCTVPYSFTIKTFGSVFYSCSHLLEM